MHSRINESALILTVLVAVIFNSCGDEKEVYRRFIDIPGSGWSMQEYCDFNTAESDSAIFSDPASHYDVILMVRYTDAYRYTDLYLSLETYPDIVLPAECKMHMAGHDGHMLGRGSHGIYMIADTIARSVHIPRLFRLNVSQAMHRDDISGIASVGLIIKKTD